MSVYRPKKSPFFHFDFWLSGVRFSGSTGATARDEAERVEAAERRGAAHQIEAARSVDRTEISYVWARFWTEKGQHDRESDTTFYRMERLQDGISQILKARGRSTSIGNVGDDVIAEYVARRRGQPLARRLKDDETRLPSNATINRELQILRRILRRAAQVWKLAIGLPAWGELMLPEADERVVTMGPGRETELLAAMRPEFRAATRFLILSGLRSGNVFPLQPDCVDFEQGIIVLKVKSKKPGGRQHILPITHAMQIILANELHHHPASVFTLVVDGQCVPMKAGTFRKALKRAAAAIGWPDLRVHDLRHVAGTRTLAATGNMRAAQTQLGHTRISTTAKYAHILVEETRAAMERAHDSEPTTQQPANKKLL